MSQIKFEIVEVTPEIAKEYLSRIDLNSRYHKATVDLYARDMKSGQWTLNNDFICIADDGQLLNGRHRLNAIIQSKTTQKMAFAYGITKDTFGNMDIGLKRTSRDNFKFQYDVDVNGQKIADINLIGAVVSNKRKFTIYEQKQIYDLFCDEIEKIHSMNDAPNVAARLRVACEIAMFIYNTPFSTIKRFYEIVHTGFAEGEHENKAVACRNALNTSEYAAVRSQREKTVKMIITQICDFAKGRTGKRITPTREIDFTEIKNLLNI